MKRLLALLLGGLGLRALLRRRPVPALEASHADDLRAKLAEARASEPEEAAAEDSTVDGRRADLHRRTRSVIDELRD